MTRVNPLLLVSVLAMCAIAIGSCNKMQDLADGGADGDSDGDSDTDSDTYGGFDGVDMLVVVNNSMSMAEEQEILATAFFPLVNSLIYPLPDWPYPGVDDIRIAVITSDMSLSWGGNPYTDGDGWPGSNPCSPSGDNGVFQTYDTGTTVNIEHNAIPCDGSNAQCPTGWTCSVTSSDEIGTCQAPGGDGADQICPDMGFTTWSETTEISPNAVMAFEMACLADQGNWGCGYEQSLQAAAVALTRPDQQVFVRDDALLAILVVSDNSDCSIEDGPALFASDEVQDQSGISKLHLACGNNQGYLYDVEHYYTAYAALKTAPNSVVFAAITGVPKVAVCEGAGDTLGDCLDHPNMELVPVVKPNIVGTDTWYFENACTGTVTEAQPGRRYVQLANEKYGALSYISSICNDDWTPSMEDIARLIAASQE